MTKIFRAHFLTAFAPLFFATSAMASGLDADEQRMMAWMRRIDEPAITAEVLENPFNDRRCLDAGNDPQSRRIAGRSWFVTGCAGISSQKGKFQVLERRRPGQFARMAASFCRRSPGAATCRMKTTSRFTATAHRVVPPTSVFAVASAKLTRMQTAVELL